MLPKHLRLDPKEIPTIAKRGKRKDSEYFYVKYWLDDSFEDPKFAISISVKVDKRASVRNQIKRKLRTAIVNLNDSKDLRKASYLIVVKDPELNNFKSQSIMEQLRTLI